MILIHDFHIALDIYVEKGTENDFPDLYSCPSCHSEERLQRHGFYWRYGMTEERTERIPICRLKCLYCTQTFSILPDFLIPYYQHTLHTVVDKLEQDMKGKRNMSRQLIAFYQRRFLSQLNWIHSAFMDWKASVTFPCKKENATKYVTMIRDFGESTFLRRSKGHLSTYFMAPSL